jgi:hypothetical protein
MSAQEEALPILDITREFFSCPIWTETIKDFVLANCYMFFGEGEYGHEHMECHKNFCELIEHILTEYLLNIIGVTFDDFQKAVLDAYKTADRDSVAAAVISILKQATDFTYFARRMYIYNCLLEKEVAHSVRTTGSATDSHAFFTLSDDLLNTIDDRVATAQEMLNGAEQELGIPATEILALMEFLAIEELLDGIVVEEEEESETAAQPDQPQPRSGQPVDAQSKTQPPSKTPAKAEAPPPAMDPNEAVQKRRAELIEKGRSHCQQEIDTHLKARERPAVVKADAPDAVDALRQALASRVKEMMDDKEGK